MASRPEVSVVIPSYRGVRALGDTLSSLDMQSLDPGRFEAVVAVNGPTVADRDAFDELAQRFGRLEIRYLFNTEANASRAWNDGIEAAHRDWLTFLDDDDTLSPGFLEALLDRTGLGVVPLGRIDDVDEHGMITTDTPLNRRFDRVAGRSVKATALPQALGFNAAKLVTTSWARSSSYPLDLTNGQDVVFWAGVARRHDIRFAVTSADADARYCRGVLVDSMSRQTTAQFAVDDRLSVIEKLTDLRSIDDERTAPIIDHLIDAQAHLLNRYVLERPSRRRSVVGRIRKRAVADFPYSKLNRDLANTLYVVSDDGSFRRQAIRLGAYIAVRKRPVDLVVITNDIIRTRGVLERFWNRDRWRHLRGREWLIGEKCSRWDVATLSARLMQAGGDQRFADYSKVQCLSRVPAIQAFAASLRDSS